MLFVTLHANWGGGTGGSVGTGTFHAFGTSQVEMQREELSIRLYRDHAQVRVQYVMKNTGGDVDVRAGFPSLEMWEPKKEWTEVRKYHLTVDGEPVAHTMEKGKLGNWKDLFSKAFLKNLEPGYEETVPPGSEPDCPGCQLLWLVSTVHFAAGQSRQVIIEYESEYQNSEGGFSNDSDVDGDFFRYILSSAATWKGPIQSGRVVIEAVTVDPALLVIDPPNHFQRAGNRFEWSFTNLRPTDADNIQVRVNDPYYTIWDYPGESQGLAAWYSFEGDRYYYDFAPRENEVTASSERKGYSISNVTNNEPDKTWVADKPGGIGETITITLKDPQRVDEVGIYPGYGKSEEVYFANNRIRELELVVNGTSMVTATLPDNYVAFTLSKKAFAWINLGKYDGAAKTITLRIKSVYPGKRWNDTCIGKVLLRKRLLTKPNPQRAS